MPPERRATGRSSPSKPPSSGFLGRWVGWVTLGETVGFLVPAVAGIAASLLGLSVVATHVLVSVAGSGEGALLGAAQATALVRSPVRVPVRRWVAVTAVAASFAWAIGMVPVSTGGLLPATPAGVAATVLGGLALLVSIPLAQWFVLRKVAPRAWRWIPVNVAAWAVGISATLLPSPLVDESTGTNRLLLLYGSAGLVMALVVALLTGLGMRRILRP